MEVAFHLLRSAVDHDDESLMSALRRHPRADLGDPSEVGTGAWHLRHLLETFRDHAAIAAPELLPWPSIPFDASSLGMADALLSDVDQFIAWWAARPMESPPVRVPLGGRTIDLQELVGVMTRHITWHAAAVHYWCKWRAVDAAGT